MILAVGALDDHPAQSDRQLGVALAGELDALWLFERVVGDKRQAHIGLRPGDEDRLRFGDCRPPAIMAIALVEDIGGARLGGDGAADLGVVDMGVGDVEDARAVGLRVVDDMQLHAADPAVRLGPVNLPRSEVGVHF